jgi:hypothetical protein
LPYAVAREVEDIDALIDEVGGTAFVSDDDWLHSDALKG